jgi:toxin FitB
MSLLALDTSVAVPLLLRSHAAHESIRRAVAGGDLCFTAHSLAETYSVLTRLPDDARLDPTDATRLLSVGFEAVLIADAATLASLPSFLSERAIAGGAVYDALVALAVFGTTATLLTRDTRAAGTYSALGVQFRQI